ncbi:ECF-type riboflavin transporter substrate-binding protein [Weissella coleopterorum]|uniref:ECF-type riboflavin transporter substrate-binding protein n=1 Tax=Weissella coleopterorum TaxID=2714949 RepID=A0A6G8B180_9LACO|nr:ECF-type riboflavin transporter substrate-binding protein [Weissella coleopterorum]QIL50990.1 ECF-type riboflavin transporter substrate-binding protein [Weissella coleopterorum]
MRFKKIKWIFALSVSILFFAWLMRTFHAPLGVMHTQINIAMAWLAFVTSIFGPIFGLMVGLLGHALQDYLLLDNAWWSWVIADGLFGLLLGLVTQRLQLIFSPLTWQKIIAFNVWQGLANIIAWIVIAPLGDILIYGSKAKLVFQQGLYAGIANFIVIAIGGTLLIMIANSLVKLLKR